MKNCSNCRYCVQQDFGYSNYTVEGTEVNCLLNKNPGFPKDRWYGVEPALKFAENCDAYSYGNCVSIDVDQEEVPYSDSGKITAIASAYSNGDKEIQALLEKFLE